MFLKLLNKLVTCHVPFETLHYPWIASLDIDILCLNGKFTTSVYRKPTFTGLFTNFHSFIPLTYKCCLVSGMLHRIFNICSCYESFHENCSTSMASLHVRLTVLFAKSLTILSNPNLPVLTAPKKTIYFCLPFTGSHSLQIHTQVRRLCNAASLTLASDSSSIPSHVHVPKYPRSGIVYVFKCRCCSASYVGQTTRHLHTRNSKHLGISPILGISPLNVEYPLSHQHLRPFCLF